MFEQLVPSAPFKLDLSKTDDKYTDPQTQRCFQQFAEGYFDGYVEADLV